MIFCEVWHIAAISDLRCEGRIHLGERSPEVHILHLARKMSEDTSEARRDQTVILHQPPVGRFFSRSAEELQPGDGRANIAKISMHGVHERTIWGIIEVGFVLHPNQWLALEDGVLGAKDHLQFHKLNIDLDQLNPAEGEVIQPTHSQSLLSLLIAQVGLRDGSLRSKLIQDANRRWEVEVGQIGYICQDFFFCSSKRHIVGIHV
mmetsp:Transcript_40365/g.66672  ORF Transcript_40365/g.66672 Transcript_40365/m.66672 type:complete len:205 (-) Transcript_40365:16-630(-)